MRFLPHQFFAKLTNLSPWFTCWLFSNMPSVSRRYSNRIFYSGKVPAKPPAEAVPIICKKQKRPRKETDKSAKVDEDDDPEDNLFHIKDILEAVCKGAGDSNSWQMLAKQMLKVTADIMEITRKDKDLAKCGSNTIYNAHRLALDDDNDCVKYTLHGQNRSRRPSTLCAGPWQTT